MIKTLRDSYDYYCKLNGSKRTYSQYYKICVSLNQEFFEFIQEGKGNRIAFGNRLGQMQYFKFKKKAVNYKGRIIYPINWPETNKLWKESPELTGKNYVYYTRNWYIGVRWIKGPAKTTAKYIKFYKFRTSRTNGSTCKSGNKNKIVSLLKEDELYYLNFPEYDLQASKL